MEKVIQLNLFGEIPSLIDHDYDILSQSKEKGNTHGQGKSSSRALEKLSTNNVPGTTTERQTGRRNNKRSGAIQTSLWEFDRIGNVPPRSTRDASSSVHPVRTRTELRGAGTRRLNTDDCGNFSIKLEDELIRKGKVAKFEDNFTAIKLLKDIERRGAYATPEQQKILACYAGWGGVSEVFNENNSTWNERRGRLKDLLSEDEYREASRSTQYAHFTPPEVIDTIWNAVKRMGFSGGPTLEPAMGTGNFFGLKPSEFPIEMHGIEQDSISGRISRQLYQKACIEIESYQNVKIQENVYNLAISNVPFSDFKPYEPSDVKTPGIDKPYSLHDFYFLKTLHGVKPGGIIAFVTSRFTMDKDDPSVRKKISEKADFIGAIRLPDTTFKEIAHTAVTTDILFLQKRPENKPQCQLNEVFINTEGILLTGQDSQMNEISINKYYVNHPEMVIGEQTLTGSMWNKNQYNVTLSEKYSTSKFSDLLKEKIRYLPENIYSIVKDNTEKIESDKKKIYVHFNDKSVLPGSFVIGDDNNIYQNISKGHENIFSLLPMYDNELKHQKDITKLRKMIEIKETLKKVISISYSHDNAASQRELHKLNQQYDSFVKQFGYLSKASNVRLMESDPEHSMILSLEHWDSKTKQASKADIFKGLSVKKSSIIDKVETPEESLAVSLAQYGCVNIKYMASMLQKDETLLVNELLLKKLLYADPEDFLQTGNITYKSSDEYLCGNVRWKLQRAEEACKIKPAIFNSNALALKSIIPSDLGPNEILVNLNSPAVGEQHIKDFINTILDSDNLNVIHIAQLGKWEIRGYCSSVKNHSTYGTSRLEGKEIIELLLNNKPIRIYDTVKEDGKSYSVFNQTETSKAELKAESIKTKFQEWIWRDPERTKDICERYNNVFNNLVNRKYIHPQRRINRDAKVFFPGCNFAHPARPHQADAVWRCIQNQNNMLAHTVGAGKTLEIIWSSMELKRLGLRNKNLIVVPNHLVKQWTEDFREAYPQAKLLVASEKNFNKQNRKIFINQIVTGQWDAVIIKMSHFKMIPLSPEKEEAFLRKKVSEYRQILGTLDQTRYKSRSQKEIEKAVEKFEERIKMLNDQPKDRGVFYFDKLGIDQIFVDEADMFKNLEYYTQLKNIRGMGNPVGSAQAFDMYMKIQTVQETGGGVTFATGTPISNTLVEAYTMQRFLQPEKLEAQGLVAFDEWARQYAQIETQMELNNTGTGYKPVTRFSKIINVPELIACLNESWDIQTADNLEKNKILVQGINLPIKRSITISTSASPLLKSFLVHLRERENNLSHSRDRKSDNVLKIISDGKKAAIDLRMIHRDLPNDPESKLNRTIDLTEELYKRYAKQRYLTLIFIDEPNSKSGFNCICEMKKELIKRGVEDKEIADIRSCKSDMQKRELFRECNDGKVRVLFGSTKLMGAGTNIQERLKALIHVDAPWRPRDIEQRNGRAFRPGNMVVDFDSNGNGITPHSKKGTVLIYNMVTKGSLDTGLWHVLETKNNSIQQIMNCDNNTIRELTEDYYGSVKELSIDNPLMKEAVELNHEIKQLKNQFKAHNAMISEINRKMVQLPKSITSLQKKLILVQEDKLRRVKNIRGESFTIKIEGNNYNKRNEAGAKILSIIENAKIQINDENKAELTRKNIGNFAGFDLGVYVSRIGKNCYDSRVYVSGNYKYSAQVKDDQNSSGLMVSLTNAVIKDIDFYDISLKREIAEKQKYIDEYKQNSLKDFDKLPLLKQKENKLKEIMLKIEDEEKKVGKKGEESMEFR